MKRKAKKLTKTETKDIYCALTTGTMIHKLGKGPEQFINTVCGKQFEHGFVNLQKIDGYKKCPFCFKK